MPVIQIDPDRSADCLTIGWRLPAGADAVWAHLQDVDALSEWLGRPLTFDSRLGGEIIVDHADSYLCRSEVLAIDGHSAELTWSFPDEPTSRISVAVAAGDLSGEGVEGPSADGTSTSGTSADGTSASGRSADGGDEKAPSVLTLRHLGLGDLIDSYATGWLTHLSFFEASLAGTPLPWEQFWPLCETFDRLLNRTGR